MNIIIGISIMFGLCVVLGVCFTLFAYATIKLDEAITNYVRNQK